MFSLEPPHRGDSNEYTQYTIFNMKKGKSHYIITIIPKLQLWDSFPRDSRKSKRAISAQATEGLLYNER